VNGLSGHQPTVGEVGAVGEVRGRVEEYIALRRGLGYRSRAPQRLLRGFADTLDAAGHHGPIALEDALAWAAATSSTDPHNPARRLTVIRGFLRHLSALDGATQVPAPGLLGPSFRRTQPHVYSDAEIADLIAAALDLDRPDRLRPHCYATLFALLACTGLRIAEAQALSIEDVDLTGGMLTVRAGKRGRTRLVPLHPSTLAPLRHYAARRARHCGRAFFRTDRSDHVSYNTAHHTFALLRRRLGWTTQGRTRLPRIHDLRHRFVVRRIQAWHTDGINVDAKIPALATYLGHAQVSDVYWYLSAVPELMDIISARFKSYTHPGDDPDDDDPDDGGRGADR
jgi:integrase/recombinase XerD